MPEKNGYEAATDIRKLEAASRTGDTVDESVYIIALTAGIVSGEKERCLRAGMNDYVSKPIVGQALADALRKWLVPQEI